MQRYGRRRGSSTVGIRAWVLIGRRSSLSNPPCHTIFVGNYLSNGDSTLEDIVLCINDSKQGALVLKSRDGFVGTVQFIFQVFQMGKQAVEVVRGEKDPEYSTRLRVLKVDTLPALQR